MKQILKEKIFHQDVRYSQDLKNTIVKTIYILSNVKLCMRIH